MDFLFKDRGLGKRTIKPSKDSEVLEAMMTQDAESDDSDFDVDLSKVNSDEESDSGAESEDGDNDSDSDSDASNEESEGDGDEGRKEDLSSRLRAGMSTAELINLMQNQGEDGRGVLTNGAKDMGKDKRSVVPVCGMCLGERSDHTNEIVECDGCGVMVHEVCYGILESSSIASNVSAASTEPWFCEPCMAGVKCPPCEVCPLKGGIYKETDVGRWIHLVCALYIPNIKFFDQARMTRVTLFEVSYKSWGARACHLCKDIKMAKTGICIECDAGMCRQYFHVTCAQEAGLLSEPSEVDSDQFFGHCKAHTDRDVARRRRGNLVRHRLHASVKQGELELENVDTENNNQESSAARIRRKLKRARERWVSSAPHDGLWVPTQKMPRLLLTSSTAIRSLRIKSDLHGWDSRDLDQEEHNIQAVKDIGKKWNVQPAFTVEFVAYYHHRNARLARGQERLAEMLLANNQLNQEDKEVVNSFHSLNQQLSHQKEVADDLKKKVKLFEDLLQACDPKKRKLGSSYPQQKIIQSPLQEPVAAPTNTLNGRASRKSTENATHRAAASSRKNSSRQSNVNVVNSVVELASCALCKSNNSPSLLALCDVCHLHYHLSCLTPPLTKMPKKTRQYGWQCSECDNSVNTLETPPVEEIEGEGEEGARPTRTRHRQKEQSVSPSRKVKEKKEAPPPPPKEPQVKVEEDVKPTPLPAAVGNQVPSQPARRGKKRARQSSQEEQDRIPSPIPAPVPLSPKEVTNPQPTFNSTPSITNTAIPQPCPILSSLPPKKLFKSKAIPPPSLPPAPSPPLSKAASPTSEREIDSLGFKSWLQGKFNSGVTSNGDTGCSPTPTQATYTPTEETLTTVSAKLSLDTSGLNGDASDESSGDEGVGVGGDRSGGTTPCQELEVNRQRQERKRAKREEKEKRREERRKRKMLKTQGEATWSTSIKIVEDIEEDENCCVVRIAPKPIKIKIKTSSGNPRPDFSVYTKKSSCTPIEVKGGDSSCPSRDSTPSPPPPCLPTSSSPSPLPSSTTTTHVHPKKKAAHMDYSLQVEELGFGYSVTTSSNSGSATHVVQASTNSHYSPLTSNGGTECVASVSSSSTSLSSLSTVSSSAEVAEAEATPSQQDLGARVSARQQQQQQGEKVQAANRAKVVSTGARDVRTHCDTCNGEGNNSNLVRCDDCGKCFHFSCLNPPVRKSPKVSGWAWACADCAPSDTEQTSQT